MQDGRKNFGYGRALCYALCQAICLFYGVRNHFGTRRTHMFRIRVFVRFCQRHGVHDARLITQALLDAYGQYLRARLVGEYEWADGETEKSLSVAYAHNLISTANTALYAIRGDARIQLSPRKALGASRSHVRKTAAIADIELVDQAVAEMTAKGDDRGAAVVRLARLWGMRAQEATLQNLDRMLEEIARTGSASILDGCKGGRKDIGRKLSATPERMAALEYALTVRPAGSRCLLAADENVKLLYQRELNRCRRVLKAHGIPSYRELRAGFAADIYEEVTGVPPMQGIAVDVALDKAARKYLSRVLGHGREQVSSCYVGGY